MSDYGRAAKYYDILYGAEKDYAAEADLLTGVIRAHVPDAASVLDVGCGTGAHGRHLIDRGFMVDGVDLDPTFVEIARGKCPEGEFHVGDMRSFKLARRYDAVVSLFSAIGYVRDEAGLNTTLRQMAQHVTPQGVVVIEPWFEPGDLTHGRIMVVSGESNDTSVCRMSRTLVEDSISRLEFEYMVGSEAGIERISECHELGLFTEAQMKSAFMAAGLAVNRIDEAPMTRGMYVGQRDRAGPD